MKKLISLICVLLSFSLLVSCRQETASEDYDHAADFTEEDGELYKSVPKKRFDGSVFRILNAKVGSSASLMDTDTLEGDNLNSALFMRNTNVEERINVVIEEVYDTPKKAFDTAVAACLSGEDTYSAICNTASNMATMAVCGYLVTEEELPGLDLSKPWWNTAAIDGAAVDSTRFFFFGDLQLSYYDAHSMVGVNMDMLSEIDGAKNPYTLVETGNWTVDEMLKIMTAASEDIDGDGRYTCEDHFGVAIDKTEVLSLVAGCNSFMSAKDEYGLPVMSCLTDEKFYDAFKLISDSLYTRSDYVYDTVKNEADGISPAAHFKGEYSLFYIANVGALANLRTVEFEFAVLPMPKYAPEQKNYVSYISGNNASAIGVMATGRNLLRAGNVLENLCAESHRKGGLRDCYVDSVLAFKYVNHDKSRENLTTILSSGVLDPAEIYGWGGIAEKLTALAGDSDTYASTIASVRLKSLSDINDTIKEVNDHK